MAWPKPPVNAVNAVSLLFSASAPFESEGSSKTKFNAFSQRSLSRPFCCPSSRSVGSASATQFGERARHESIRPPAAQGCEASPNTVRTSARTASGRGHRPREHKTSSAVRLSDACVRQTTSATSLARRRSSRRLVQIPASDVDHPFPKCPERLYSISPSLAAAMAINGHRNKPIGPGGGTRRLHPSPSPAAGFGGGEIGSTRA